MNKYIISLYLLLPATSVLCSMNQESQTIPIKLPSFAELLKSIEQNNNQLKTSQPSTEQVSPNLLKRKRDELVEEEITLATGTLFFKNQTNQSSSSSTALTTSLPQKKQKSPTKSSPEYWTRKEWTTAGVNKIKIIKMLLKNAKNKTSKLDALVEMFKKNISKTGLLLNYLLEKQDQKPSVLKTALMDNHLQSIKFILDILLKNAESYTHSRGKIIAYEKIVAALKNPPSTCKGNCLELIQTVKQELENAAEHQPFKSACEKLQLLLNWHVPQPQLTNQPLEIQQLNTPNTQHHYPEQPIITYTTITQNSGFNRFET